MTPTMIALAAAGLYLATRKPKPPPWLGLSDGCLSTLLPEVAELAVALITRAAAEGIPLVAVSCYRTAEKQAQLYAKGRTAEGKIVTNARPGYSWHNHRRAFDVAVLDAQGNPSWPNDTALWNRIGALGQSVGLSWGGDFGDRPHFDFHPDLTISQAYAAWKRTNPSQGAAA